MALTQTLTAHTAEIGAGLQRKMKVILSRKGFDSCYGGYPSPILPDGRMISLPIPSSEDSICYKDLKIQNKNLYELMRELFDPKDRKPKIKINGKWVELTEQTTCHLDPDIYHFLIDRDKEWTPLFGQCKAAQSHLENKNVTEGDLFLFFGSFRKTKYDRENESDGEGEGLGAKFRKTKYVRGNRGKLVFDPEDREKHIIFGYFQIGKIVKVSEETKLPKWMLYHPHTIKKRRNVKNNTIYVARKRLSWNSSLPGAYFFNYSKNLVLTKEGCPKSYWNLPTFFRNLEISYHSNNSWKSDGTFKSAGRGQEFVIEENEKVEEWAKNLIEENFYNTDSDFPLSLTLRLK